MTPHAAVAADTLRAGAAASAVALPLAEVARRLGVFDIDLFRLMGTLVTPQLSTARRTGVPINAINAIGFAALYRWAFDRLGVQPSAPTGAILGVAHFVMGMSGVALLSRLHPRPLVAGLRPDKRLGTRLRSVPVMLAGHALYGALVGRALR